MSKQYLPATVLLLVLLVGLNEAYSQIGSQRQWLRAPMLRLMDQPAALADSVFPSLSVQGNITFNLAGSAGLLDMYLENDGFLDDDEKQVIIDRLGTSNRFQYNDRIGPLMIAGKIGKLPFSLAYEQNRSFAIGFDNPQSFELVFGGNAQFAGQTVNDELSYHRLRADRVSLGTAFRIGKLAVGLRGHYLIGARMTSMDRFAYSLFTAEDGDLLGVSADYSLYEAVDNGSGLGFDLGLNLPLGDKMEFQATVQDLGFMSWEANEMVHNVQFDFEGMNLNDMVDGGLNDFQFEDTLRKSLFPDSSLTTFSHALPTRMSAGLSLSPREGCLWVLQVSHVLSNFAPGGGSPSASLAYQRQWKSLSLGGQVFAGGVEGWGLGAVAALHVKGQNGFSFDLLGEVRNGMSLLTASNGGLRGNAGIAIGF